MADHGKTLSQLPLACVRTTAIAGAAILALMAGAAHADVKDGVDAWSAGDYDRAVAEWHGPAAAGDADALFNLAQAYRLGRGVATDVARAERMYAEAAEKGHVKAADNYGLLLFQQGKTERAMPLIRSAAERGDPRAQYLLGLAHFNGDLADKDWVRAYALLTLSQAQGLPQAANALVEMDRYVPERQRQLAQALARDIEAEAIRSRATSLAAVDLAPQTSSETAVPAEQPVQVAAASLQARNVAQPKPAAEPVAKPDKRPVSDWKVQLGAFGVAGNADRLWNKLSGTPELRGTSKLLVPTGKVTRLQASGFASQAEATSACSQLKKQGHSCLVTRK